MNADPLCMLSFPYKKERVTWDEKDEAEHGDNSSCSPLPWNFTFWLLKASYRSNSKSQKSRPKK
ncbi:hypothetical protein Dimus_032809 [Dionaea muscipula]